MFDNSNTDTLSNLFGNLCGDIQEKIYNQVLIIKDTEKNKRYFSGYILGELKYKWDNVKFKDGIIIKSNDSQFGMYMDRYMKMIYKHYSIGVRTINDTNGIIEIDKLYDNIYYENLDYLLMCDNKCILSKEEVDISFSYTLKENHKWRKYQYDYEIEEDNFDFKYNIISTGFHLWDFIDGELDMEDIDFDLYCEFELLMDTINEYTNEEILSVLIRLDYGIF